jgi:disulfide bond formation protein DsbB
MFIELGTLNFLFALGGVFLIPVTVALYVDYFFAKSSYYMRWFKEYTWPLIMCVTIGSVVISLIYSEYFGFIPCSLCWLQRIALYPQALLSVIAFKIKDTLFFPLYSIVLSLFGFAVGIYHYIYQMWPKEEVTADFMPCLADGSADCAVRIIDEFGFVTFPLLSAISFAFLIILYLNARRLDKASE